MRLRLPAALALLAMGLPAAKADESVAIRNRDKTIFAVTRAGGSALKLTPARLSAPADALPKPGEISLSLSTTYAVGAPKLHVYNQYAKAIRFTFTAMRGGTVLASDSLCGHLDTDSWTVLPPKTSRVVVSHVVALDGDCP